MHAFTRQRVQVDRQRRHQRLALAGAHLGNLALMQSHATNQLHVKVSHFEHAPTGFAHYGERFYQQIIERFAIRDAFFELGSFATQLLVRQRFEAILKRVDLDHIAAKLFEQAVVTAAKYCF